MTFNEEEFQALDKRLAAEFEVVMRDLHRDLSGTIAVLQLEINKFEAQANGRPSVFLTRVQACVASLGSLMALINSGESS